ncbi:hypothetical protein EFM1CSP_19390 [Enterococcus faecium]|nr:hypothetical protein EFM1CSP_19390 [Enterococcus faecium]
MLPYTSKTGFSVADAYATGGQVVAADQVGNTGNSNGESGFLDLQGVVFHACANAMRANHISESSLPEQVIVVPAGVLDLVELQSQGYAYIKP